MKCIIKGKVDSLNLKGDDLVIEGKFDASDSYHTFDELYAHRILLFVSLMKCNKDVSWKSRLHSDGSSIDGWFVGGINLPSGCITYHLPNKFWEMVSNINTLEKAPEWDGHSSQDVIIRLNNWCMSI